MNKNWFTVNMNATVPEVLVNGYIGQDDKVNYADFKTCIDQIKNAGYVKAKIKLNTGGGDMLEGFAIYDYAAQSGIAFEVEIIGIAASMGSVLMLMGENVPNISEHGRIMLHKPKAVVFGEADSMSDTVKVMNELEADVKAILKQRTGQSDEVINAWFVRGKDTWFTAKEAKKAGLVRNIVKGTPAPKNTPPQNATEEQVWRVYNSVVTNNSTDMLSVTMLAKLALPQNATAAEIETKINAILEEKDGKINTLTSKVTELEKTINDAATAAANALKVKGETFFNKLVEAKKTTADKKDEFLKAYMASPATIEMLYDGVPGAKGVVTTNTGASAPGSAKPQSEWSVSDYQAANKMDELEKLRIENRAEYDAVMARYRKELANKKQ